MIMEKHICYLSYFFATFINFIDASFTITFQSSGRISTDEWAEYQGDMPHAKNLSICHWDRLEYFNDDVSSLWSYCTQETSHSKMMCVQMEYKSILSKANRHMKLNLWIYNDLITVKVIPFRHREWNHICWTYSFENNWHRIYINGELKASKVNYIDSKITVWKASSKVKKYAFVIGQEPDSIRGGYTIDQLFQGSIYELNIWNVVLDENTINDLANCKRKLKGNVKSWRIENLLVNKALVLKGKDKVSDMCNRKKMLVIFPRRQPFPVAKDICQLHGGQIHTPASREENKEVMQIIEKHKDHCMDTNKTDSRNLGKSVWLGLRRSEWAWRDVTTDRYIGSSLNYSNWAIENYGKYVEWSFIQSDGFWKYAKGKDGIELCTICSFSNIPIFTLKGVCKHGGVYYNYYFKLNDKKEIDFYETYKTSLETEHIQYLNGTWQSIGNRYSLALVSGNKTEYPIGRNKWNIRDSNCALDEIKSLSFSRCEFGEEYTCKSGHCISIDKRCNNVKDCEDNSDEMDCLIVDVPTSYRKIEPPRSVNSSQHSYSPIETKIIIRSIDEIDTLEMSIEMTIDINMVWTDNRLTYTNLLDNTRNLVDPDIANKLWNPLDYIVHDHAVTGEIETEVCSKILSVQKLTGPSPTNIFDSYENQQFSGSTNKLEITQRFRIKYMCTFNLTKFPFDKQVCEFRMHLKLKPNMTLKFQNKHDKGVFYQGSKTVDQFHVVEEKIKSETGLNHEETWFIYRIYINRDYMHQVISTLFPCCLLWLLSYFSLFIQILNFNNRFMGSVTILLVLVSLRGSIANDLPKTSYFKYIDLWFMFYITNIFFIITYHIYLDNFSPKTVLVSSEHCTKENQEDDAMQTKYILNRHRMNRYAKISFPILTIIFNIVYFSLTIW